MTKYVLAIDQGTTSSRALIYDENLAIVGQGSEAFPQHFPKTDWVEHDLEEIWNSVRNSVNKAAGSVKIPGFSRAQIAAIGITNQRETFGVWNRGNSKAVARAIVWQCRRSADICQKLRKVPAGKKLATLSGLVIDPYFSGTKLKWLFDQNKELRVQAKNGELAFGTIDTFLMWRLSSGDIHSTDVSNASRTLMMDLKTCKWSDFALKTLGVPAAMLPQICDSDEMFGVTRGLDFLPDNIPICGVLGDQQAALFGQACLNPGEAKITYGTGAFFLLNTGHKIRRTKAGLSTVAWRIDGKTSYALEGSVFIAGAAVSWMRDGLKMISRSSEIEELARGVADSDGVFFIPALSGLGAPDWAPQAKGLLGGLTRRSVRGHVARACLEGIANSIGDTFDVLVRDSGTKLKKLRADGGASLNGILLQAQSDVLQTRIERPVDIESTARGAASLAAFSGGILERANELAAKNPLAAEVKPRISKKQAQELHKLWRRRVEAMLKGAF